MVAQKRGWGRCIDKSAPIPKSINKGTQKNQIFAQEFNLHNLRSIYDCIAFDRSEDIPGSGSHLRSRTPATCSLPEFLYVANTSVSDPGFIAVLQRNGIRGVHELLQARVCRSSCRHDCA